MVFGIAQISIQKQIEYAGHTFCADLGKEENENQLFITLFDDKGAA